MEEALDQIARILSWLEKTAGSDSSRIHAHHLLQSLLMEVTICVFPIPLTLQCFGWEEYSWLRHCLNMFSTIYHYCLVMISIWKILWFPRNKSSKTMSLSLINTDSINDYDAWMTQKPSDRWGIRLDDFNNYIKKHAFFSGLKWKRIEEPWSSRFQGLLSDTFVDLKLFLTCPTVRLF